MWLHCKNSHVLTMAWQPYTGCVSLSQCDPDHLCISVLLTRSSQDAVLCLPFGVQHKEIKEHAFLLRIILSVGKHLRL